MAIKSDRRKSTFVFEIAAAVAATGIAIFLLGSLRGIGGSNSAAPSERRAVVAKPAPPSYKPRDRIDTGGSIIVFDEWPSWNPNATLAEIADATRDGGYRAIERIDRELADPKTPESMRTRLKIKKGIMYLYEGDAEKALDAFERARAYMADRPDDASRWTYQTIFLQGVSALRLGENENCIMCRGESSCILPIAPAAVHVNPRGSRLAIGFFSEYLERFPDDLEVRWLLNLAHMTLGEHPAKVDPRYLIKLDRFQNSEFDVGRFRDVGHLTGVNRFNQSGGAILDDFDGDGALDFFVTSFESTERPALFINQRNGKFVDRAVSAGLSDQLGGLFCVQTDYNNDGKIDIFICRGAWINRPIRPSLLRNDGDGKFTDVTREAGLIEPLNTITAQWADYNNDGYLDLFVACERQANRLYRNRGDGTFENVAAAAGLDGEEQAWTKGANWIDFDNDDYPDLFLNNIAGNATLHHNKRDGSFRDVSAELEVDGPKQGFSCWAWDYNNDGYLDIFATSYDHTTGDVIKGLIGEPHSSRSNRLFRNEGGKRFVDETRRAGLDLVFAAMGSNFADFDNDGYLDMYLSTGDPSLDTLIPNRMFKNVNGERFAEVTGSSRTGHLQKGHGVACGDWDRDGDVDLFIEMGGAINGDRYHDVLFQNPGLGNHSITIKLIGVKTNRAAIGARIKIVTAGEKPLVVHRHISSGSSFGANPLEQTIGVGKADRIATLEIHWPTSRSTQVFHDISVNQYLEITEFSDSYRTLNFKPIPLPQGE
jgi:tetratricopeptide (TPR) repeat protein